MAEPLASAHLDAVVGLRTRCLTGLFRSLGDRGYDGRAAELTYLAIDEKLRGAGIGGRLVEAFDRAVRDVGGTAYELSVDADNLPAMRFYETLGFVRVGEYHEFEILHKRYRRELS